MTYLWLIKLLWALFGLEICLSPDQLFYDRMPEMDGFETCRRDSAHVTVECAGGG